MAGASRCDECGADLAPESSPGGLCPNCLLKLALPASDDGSGTTRNKSSGQLTSRQIGPYRLQRKIGEGGMGEVWLAEQQAPLCRTVAVKLIKKGLDTAQVVARFEAERQALALMNHPNIAKVLDAGATEDGGPYFVMEYVSGVPITGYCDTQRVTTAERLLLFTSVCDGVQHAHQKGIIHRDIKPSNVLVELSDGKPVPKIIDFGVAKATLQRLTERSMFTELGVLIGTPEYMSPEQAELTDLDIDTRTDVYSLGMLLYELLVGALPFDARELRAAGFDEIRRRIREEEPSKPSARITMLGDASQQSALLRRTDPAALARELRGDLDWIAMRALEKDRTRRYGSPSDLAADIERHLSHEPVLAGRPSVAYRTRKFVRRHRIGVGAAAVVLAALFVGLGAATYGLIEARRANERTREEAATSEQVSEFLVGLFEVSDPNEARGNTITAREILDRGVERIEEELVEQPLVRERLRRTMGRVYRSLGLHDEAAPMLEAALRGQREHLGEAHPSTLETMSDLGWLYLLEGRWDDAEELFAETVDLSRDALGSDHELTLGALNRLANVYRLRGRYAEAEPMFVEALEGHRRALGEEHVSTRATMVNLAVLYLEQGRFDEAEDLQVAALRLERRLLGDDHPETLETMERLAWLHLNQGRTEEAERLSAECLQKRRRVLGEDHPRTLESKNSLGNTYRIEGRYDEAEGLLSEALNALRRTLGPDHLTTRGAMVNLAAVYTAQQRYGDAEPLELESLEADRRVDGQDHPNTLTSMHELATLYKRQKRYGEAEELYLETLEARRRVLGENHHRTLTSQHALGQLYRIQGRIAEAEQLLLDSLAGRRKALGEDHWQTRESAGVVLALFAATDRVEQARSLATQILSVVDAGQIADLENPGRLNTLAFQVTHRSGIVACAALLTASTALLATEAMADSSLQVARPTEPRIVTVVNNFRATGYVAHLPRVNKIYGRQLVDPTQICSGTLAALNTRTFEVTTNIMSQACAGIAANPANGLVYVIQQNGMSIAVIDSSTDTVIATHSILHAADKPLVIDFKRGRLYAPYYSNFSSKAALRIWDIETFELIASHQFESNLWHRPPTVLLSSRRGVALVQHGSRTEIVDGVDGTILNWFWSYEGLSGINEKTQTAYTANQQDGIGAYDLVTLEEVAYVPYIRPTSQLVVNPRTDRIYGLRHHVTNGLLWELDGTTLEAISVHELGPFLGSGIAANIAGGRVYTGSHVVDLSIFDVRGRHARLVTTLQGARGEIIHVDEKTNRVYSITPARTTVIQDVIRPLANQPSY